jgi:hypothetical protein
MPTALSPLRGTPRNGSAFQSSSRTRLALVSACALALLATLGFVSQGAHLAVWTSLIQRSNLKAPLLYIPRSALKANALPLHIEVPLDGDDVDYTLVESPITSLHNFMLDEILSNATNATNGSTFKCTLEGVTIDGNEQAQINIRKEAAKAFAMWDKCQYAEDYKQPNRGNFNISSRRLLTQDILKPQPWTYPSAPNATEVCGDPSFPCPGLAECEALAAKVVCKYLSKCTNPVCSSFYTEPDIERICGICTMASSAVTRSCWSSFHDLLHCMGMA